MVAPLIVRILHSLLRALLRILFRLEVKGAEQIPKGEPYILIANHISRLDPLLLLGIFPLVPRIWFLAATIHTTEIPWRKRLLDWTGGIITVDDRNPMTGKRAIQQAEAILKQGMAIGIFPEGRVGDEDMRLQPCRPGAAVIALRANVPVVPVWIAGASRVYWRKHIQVVIGEPFYPPSGVARDAATASISSALMTCRDRVQPIREDPSPVGLWLNKLL